MGLFIFKTYKIYLSHWPLDLCAFILLNSFIYFKKICKNRNAPWFYSLFNLHKCTDSKVLFYIWLNFNIKYSNNKLFWLKNIPCIENKVQLLNICLMFIYLWFIQEDANAFNWRNKNYTCSPIFLYICCNVLYFLFWIILFIKILLTFFYEVPIWICRNSCR